MRDRVGDSEGWLGGPEGLEGQQCALELKPTSDGHGRAFPNGVGGLSGFFLRLPSTFLERPRRHASRELVIMRA